MSLAKECLASIRHKLLEDCYRDEISRHFAASCRVQKDGMFFFSDGSVIERDHLASSIRAGNENQFSRAQLEVIEDEINGDDELSTSYQRPRFR